MPLDIAARAAETKPIRPDFRTIFRISHFSRVRLHDRGDLKPVTEPTSNHLPSGEGRWTAFDSDQRMEPGLGCRNELTWLRDGADGFARFVEDAQDLTEDPTQGPDIGPADPAAEQGAAPDKRGHQDDGPRRAMV